MIGTYQINTLRIKVSKNVSANFSDFEPDVDLMMKLKELRLKIARE